MTPYSVKASIFYLALLEEYINSYSYSTITMALPKWVGETLSSILLFCLVFGMSATVEMKSLKKQVQNRAALGVGILMQFVVLPFVGFVVVKILQLPSTTGIILLVITSSPGGSYSNWWCSLFNAELALSVTMTTISTLLSVVMLPTNLVLYTRWSYSADVVKSLDWAGLVVSLVVVISGIGGGLFSSYRAEHKGNKAKFRRTANLLGNIAGISLVTLSVTVSSSGGGGDSDNSKASLWDQDWKFYVGVALPAVIGLLVAVKMATHFQLEPPERVAVAVEACYQNTGIATSVALALYTGDELATAIGVPLFYGIVEAGLLGLFCIICWKRGWTKAPPDDNICKVICTSYEVNDDDDHASNKSDDDEGGASTDQTDSEAGVPQTELVQQSGATVITSTKGDVAVVRGDDVDEEEEMPKVSTWERTMMTMRARAAGYGFGVQDEDKGLKMARGPVTLGLSQVASPQPDKKKKKMLSPEVKAGPQDLPVDGKRMD